MSTASTAELIADRFQQLKQNQLNSDSSIENTVGNTTNNTSIETTAVNQELPSEIKELITGNDYWALAKSNRLYVRDTSKSC